MDATMMVRERRLPVAPGKVRRTVTLSVELAERIRRFWHERMLDRESEAYELLLKRGLEAIERQDQGKRRRIRKEDE
jgi:hypothetical protein